MKGCETYVDAREYIQNKLKVSIADWDALVEFVNRFEEADPALASLTNPKVEMYVGLFLQQLSRKREAPKPLGQSTEAASEKGGADHLAMKASEFRPIEHEDIDSAQIFEFECENKVPVTDFFRLNTLRITLESIRKGRLANWLTEHLIIRTEPMGWIAERTFADLERLIHSLRAAYPHCVVS